MVLLCECGVRVRCLEMLKSLNTSAVLCFFFPPSSCKIKYPIGNSIYCVVLLCEFAVRGHCLEMLNYLRHQLSSVIFFSNRFFVQDKKSFGKILFISLR